MLASPLDGTELAADVKSKVVVVSRGGSKFVDKARAVQAAGGAALVVITDTIFILFLMSTIADNMVFFISVPTCSSPLRHHA